MGARVCVCVCVRVRGVCVMDGSRGAGEILNWAE
jgi:hypothetical protein